jgi:D-alanyl-lipoteichoic acid acyltransferase DltB (MBOAT superfamily)
MLFDSPAYLLFLTLVVLIYWRLGWRKQNLFLLAASYFFYGWWDWRFLLLMAGSTVTDFVIARRLERRKDPASRRMLLVFSLVVNFGILGFFKYFNFFSESLGTALEALGVGHASIAFLQIILPPGISFYTFQEVAYVVDVYSGKLRAAKSLVDYALFVSLFPHLIAGPIQRPDHLLPQVQSPRFLDPDRFFDGCMMIASGLFRKCVIADQCALLANAAFDGKFGNNFVATVLGALAFALQIYGDFSAYSDFARGSAQLLGFHFMVNFRQPYLSASLQEFWRRWHISLSTWLRDYLYFPLGGNRHGKLQTWRNLMLTMLLGGLWHGANWTFIVWGGIHGAGLSLERMLLKKGSEQSPGFALWFRRTLTFVVVCFAWVFFRAKSLTEAGRMLAALGTWAWQPDFDAAIILLLILSITMIMIDLRMDKYNEEYLFEKTPQRHRIATAAALLTAVIMFSAIRSNAFLYFQF